MDFWSAVHTDFGLKNKTNQDAVLLKIADTSKGKICFAMICDGLGGLAQGELASAVVVRAFSEWFENDFSKILYTGFGEKQIQKSMEELLLKKGKEIFNYAAKQKKKMGTTATALFLTQANYYIMHVGDTRIYEITDHIYQLTRDQTFVQKEMEAGRMTLKDADTDARRNILLQCVGASDRIIPQFLSGGIKQDSAYLICSDGFRHVLTKEELYQYLNPKELISETVMENQLVYLTELNKYRQEMDNISAVVIRTC